MEGKAGSRERERETPISLHCRGEKGQSQDLPGQVERTALGGVNKTLVSSTLSEGRQKELFRKYWRRQLLSTGPRNNMGNLLGMQLPNLLHLKMLKQL